MNEQIPNTNPVPPQPAKFGKLQEFSNKIKKVLNPLWLKFTQSKIYTNKKIFLPLSIAFCLIFLIILIGMIFGGKGAGTQTNAGPTPVPQISQEATPSGDTLSQYEQKLTDLKSQINNLDVKQSRLQPPSLDFKISF